MLYILVYVSILSVLKRNRHLHILTDYVQFERSSNISNLIDSRFHPVFRIVKYIQRYTRLVTFNFINPQIYSTSRIITIYIK